MKNRTFFVRILTVITLIYTFSCNPLNDTPLPPPNLEQRNAAIEEVIEQQKVLKTSSAKLATSLLQHDDHRIRIAAIRRLAELRVRDISTLGAIENALNDEHLKVRVETVMALGKIGADDSLDMLVNALSDEEYKVQLWAQKALVRAKSRSIPVLIENLKNELEDAENDESDDNSDKRNRKIGGIRQSLIKIGEPAVASLSDALKYDLNAYRGHLAAVLGEIGAKASASTGALLELTDREYDSEVRAAMVRAIGKIGDVDPNITPTLIKLKKDKNKKVAQTAQKVLADFRKSESDKKNKD